MHGLNWSVNQYNKGTDQTTDTSKENHKQTNFR